MGVGQSQSLWTQQSSDPNGPSLLSNLSSPARSKLEAPRSYIVPAQRNNAELCLAHLPYSHPPTHPYLNQQTHPFTLPIMPFNPSAEPSIHPSDHPSIHRSTHSSITTTNCVLPSLYHPSNHPSILTFACLFVCSSICPTIHPFFHPPIHLGNQRVFILPGAKLGMGRNRELSCSLPIEAYFKRRAMQSGGGRVNK